MQEIAALAEQRDALIGQAATLVTAATATGAGANPGLVAALALAQQIENRLATTPIEDTPESVPREEGTETGEDSEVGFRQGSLLPALESVSSSGEFSVAGVGSQESSAADLFRFGPTPETSQGEATHGLEERTDVSQDASGMMALRMGLDVTPESGNVVAATGGGKGRDESGSHFSALSAGRPSNWHGDSFQLAALRLYQAGSPLGDYGAMDGAQADSPGAEEVGSSNRTQAPDDSGEVLNMLRQILALLQRGQNASGNNIRPGEVMGTLAAALNQKDVGPVSVPGVN